MNPLQYCINRAREQPYIKGQYRHFSVILDKRNRIVSEAANSYTKTNPVMKRAAFRAGIEHKEYLHSEISALSRDKYRRGVKLIVIRIDAKGNLCYSAPCPVCSLHIKENYPNIKSVEYSV